MEPIALTILQAAKLGGPCRSAIYEDICNGRLRAAQTVEVRHVHIHSGAQGMVGIVNAGNPDGGDQK
jgi:hypothetical protein